jgi:hypothetical protein
MNIREMRMDKPVAWMNAHTGHLCNGGFLMTKMQDYIPLYTHSMRELTDEEIKNLHEETSWLGITDPIKFAKAILKKASEK